MTDQQLPTFKLPDEAGPSTSPRSTGSRSASPNPSLRRPASHGRLAKLLLPGRSRSSSVASQEATMLTAHADDDTPASGRSTPEQRRRVGKAAATSLLANDAKYRKFASAVDKSLQSFENVNEWADFISFLSRLLKTLQTVHPPYNEIPRKLIISKRLAQCLNPALPSGVHQRALDVYAYIFSTIGVEGLKRDILIWSSGLLPFFQYAATSVRPLLIRIYESYYLPLGEDLRSATKALILALLPGMEEETGDFFDKILSLLSRISDAVTPSFFLKNVFLAIISNASSRLPALNYLARKLEPAEFASVDVGLAIRGISATLEDQNMLVRRNGLDLLLRMLKLEEGYFIEAEQKDKDLLMRAACSVLLQRELSLSRRVFTWLLGTDESPERQISYFRSYGLDLLATTLRADMESVSTSQDPQKPFKVFLSLLDKWEIGSALSERLVLPALNAVKNGLVAVPSMREEMLDTALAVYEAVEPIIIWRAFFRTLETQLDDGSMDIDLLIWTIQSLRQQDEEVQSIHMPIMLEYVLRHLSVCTNFQTYTMMELIGQMDSTLKIDIEPTINLAAALLPLIPEANFGKTDDLSLESLTHDFNDLHRTLYAPSMARVDALSIDLRSHIMTSIVKSTFDLHMILLRSHRPSTAAILSCTSMVATLIDLEAPCLKYAHSRAWLGTILEVLPKVMSFAIVNALVDVALKASRCKTFEGRLEITDTKTMTLILDSLFRYLRPDAAPYHARAVELLWEYNRLAEIHTFENVISHQMSSPGSRTQAYEAFGVLWHHTDDAMLPGEIFHTASMMIVNALDSSDPILRQIAETWMRCHLKSHFRILDPLLSRLLKPSSDLEMTRYWLDAINTLFRFGGQGLSKACQNTDIAKSVHPDIIKHSEAPPSTGKTYLDLFVHRIIDLIQIEVSSSRPGDKALVLRLQNSALNLLQILVSRGDLSPTCLTTAQDHLVAKLRSAIRMQDPVLQSKLLHLLHSTVVQHPLPKQAHRRTPSLSEEMGAEAIDFETRLVQVIVEGVSSPRNRRVLQHWVDFVLMTASQLQRRPDLLLSLCECFDDQLRRVMLQLKAIYSGSSTDDVAAGITDAEPIMLLDGLERIISLVLSSKASRSSEDGPRPHYDGSGSKILGLVSGVFTLEAPASETAADKVQYLDDTMNALLLTWSITMHSSSTGPAALSHAQIYTSTRERAHKVLEKLFKHHAAAVVGSCIQVWAAKAPEIDDVAIFDCIDTLTPSAQKVVEIVSETVHGRQGRASAEFQSDPALMGFLEAYILRLEAPIAVQIWNTTFAFAREILASASAPSARPHLFPLLKCLTYLCRTVATTSALEDRRLRRDVQEVYLKVLDAVITNMSRIAETVNFRRDASQTRTPRVDGERGSGEEVIKKKGLEQIHMFFADEVIPNLRSFLADSDKVANAAQSISSGIVMPAFRSQTPDSTILRILAELAKLPSATRAWRVQVGDAFNDARFFRTDAKDIAEWKLLILALMDSDKERFGELLGRITAAPSANIFTNREQEMLTRSLNLRRLSFVLLAADRNHHLAQLPSIQEKLVDILRTNVVSPRVHSEVYLCLRVLMCRVSAQHLTNFWPVILAELLRVFESTMDDLPPDQSEDLQLVLAACKFLDLLLVIQSEDFQIHQWMFVTDTTDAVYPPEDYMPEAIMDRLSEILSEHNHLNTTNHEPISLNSDDNMTLRRPHLTNVRNLASLYQLQPFFARASIETYEGVYGSQGVDWEVVEEGLQSELFDN